MLKCFHVENRKISRIKYKLHIVQYSLFLIALSRGKENVSLGEVLEYCRETCKGSSKGNELKAVRLTSLCKHMIAVKYGIIWK